MYTDGLKGPGNWGETCWKILRSAFEIYIQRIRGLINDSVAARRTRMSKRRIDYRYLLLEISLPGQVNFIFYDICPLEHHIKRSKKWKKLLSFVKASNCFRWSALDHQGELWRFASMEKLFYKTKEVKKGKQKITNRGRGKEWNSKTVEWTYLKFLRICRSFSLETFCRIVDAGFQKSSLKDCFQRSIDRSIEKSWKLERRKWRKKKRDNWLLMSKSNSLIDFHNE